MGEVRVRKSRRHHPSLAEAIWFAPDSLAVVQGLVKSALYAPGPRKSMGWPSETDGRIREETEQHGPVLRRG